MSRHTTGMRIGELAQRGGVSIPTIKYYLRVGLLVAGAATAPNQAIYDDSHLRTLRLIRALTGIGGLSVEATRALLAAVRRADVEPADLLAMIDRVNVAALRDRFDDQARGGVERAVSEMIAERGWQVRSDSRALGRLVDICAAAQLLGVDELCSSLPRRAEATEDLAACDAELIAALAERAVSGDGGHPTRGEAVMVATVLGAALHTALRAVALEHAVSGRLPDATERVG